jgi:hypothetical protein
MYSKNKIVLNFLKEIIKKNKKKLKRYYFKLKIWKTFLELIPTKLIESQVNP